MNRTLYFLVVVAGMGLTWSVPASAERAYVTDRLRLGVHKNRDTSDPAFTNISSGDRVDILEENNYYALVKLPDGRQGWVKKNYLLPGKPAALIVIEMEQERDEALRKLKVLRNSLSAREAAVQQMEADVSGREATAAAEQQELIELRIVRDDLAQRLEAYSFSVPGSLFFTGLAASVAIGFGVCWWWMDRRSRGRHGGFRIY